MAGTQEQEAKIYARLHANREAHIEQARRAREDQAKLAEIEDQRGTDVRIAISVAVTMLSMVLFMALLQGMKP